MAGSNSRDTQIRIEMTSSNQSRPTKSSRVRDLANDSEQEQEGIGQAKLYAPNDSEQEQEGIGQAKLYVPNDSEQEQEGIGQAKLYAPPNKEVAASGKTKLYTQLEEISGQGKLYSSQCSEIQNKNGILPSIEHSVYSETQIKGKLEEEYEEEEGSAQGKLYSLGTALRVQTNDKNNTTDHSQLWNKGKGVLEASRGVAGDIRRSLSQMKDRIVDKLAAVPVPADALDNARQSLESIIKDVTHAAQGLTKDAVHKIKVRLAEILPFVSPSQTGKIVDDVEREVLDMSEAPRGGSLTRVEKSPSDQSNKHGGHMETRGVSPSLTSSIILPPQTSSFSGNMGHLTRGVSLRSRM